jgi:tetratricopeptide (TPR) repeat protein
LNAVSDLARAAAMIGHTRAAEQLYPALAPYRGRLVVRAGAVSTWGPVCHYLGLLACTLGRMDQAVEHFNEALAWEEGAGATPWLAHSLAALAGALDRRSSAGDPRTAADCRRRARAIAEGLGMAWLLRSLGQSENQWSLLRDGDDWLLEAGAERARLRDGRGLHYLQALLAAPNRDIAALDLVAGGTGLRVSSMGPMLDEQARSLYRSRLASLSRELDAADRAGDAGRSARLGAERDALLRELRRATGLGGRSRDSSPEAERARVNATRTLRAAIVRIAEVAPRAGAHLEASIRTGGACRYEPGAGGPTGWRV